MRQHNGIWYLRVYAGIVHSFPLRRVEWIMAAFCAAWGAKLFEPGDNFDTASGSWDGLAYWSSGWGGDTGWGVLMVTMAILRVAALVINGTFHDTVYSRYSPLVRAATAFGCSVVWLFVAFSAAAASSQGAITYPFVFFLEASTTYFVVGEFGDVMRAKRRGRRD